MRASRFLWLRLGLSWSPLLLKNSWANPVSFTFKICPKSNASPTFLAAPLVQAVSTSYLEDVISILPGLTLHTLAPCTPPRDIFEMAPTSFKAKALKPCTVHSLHSAPATLLLASPQTDQHIPLNLRVPCVQKSLFSGRLTHGSHPPLIWISEQMSFYQ